MSDIINDLKQKSRKIDRLRQDKSRQEGQKEQLFKQLKDEHDVDGLVEAENEIQKLSRERVENEEVLNELGAEMDQIICNALPGSDSGSS